jgi:hypothetical protein
MDYLPEDQKKSKKPLIVGVLIAILIVIIGGALFFIWRFKAMPANTSVRTPLIQKNTNDQTANSPINSQKSASNSIERPLTAEEKVKYSFPANGDVWMRTTVPTDGTKPVTVFFLGSNKGK